MTKNQIEYWKLRWTQHYENILAHVKVAEQKETVRHNKVVENETARHNRRQERIDTQNMIINRGNLEARWEELKEKQRAALVAEALNEKKYELQVKQLLEDVRWHNVQAQDMLENRRVAIMSIKTQLATEKNKNNVEWYKAAANSLKNGYDKAAVTELLADTKSYFSNKEFDKLLSDLDANFPELQGTKETFGPDTFNQVYRTVSVNGYKGGGTGGGSRYTDPIRGSNIPQSAQNIINANKKQVTGFSESEDLENSSNGVVASRDKYGHKQYHSAREAGSTKEAVSVQSDSQRSGVIYSPGTHYGPGF